MELSLDVFRNNDAFAVAALQRVARNVPFIPTMLGQMALFDPKPLIGTEFVIIYEEDGNVRIIPFTERGSPDVQQARDDGRFFALKAKRVAKMDTLRASELLNVANMALPMDVRTRNAATVLASRTEKLKSDLEATKEFHRLAAIQGKLLDADGTTVVEDYFDTFGVTPPTLVTVNFSALTEDETQMYFQETFVQPMQLALKNRWIMGRTYIAALVGDGFWGKLMRNPAIRGIWKRQEEGRALAMAMNPLARTNNWTELDFGGIRFIHYRGSTAGDIGIASNAAHFFPVNAPDVFNVYWAPGETLPQVAQEGQPEYLMIQPDVRSEMPSHVDVFLRSYPLYACIFPKGLMRAVHA
jgi:hypothetical protein